MILGCFTCDARYDVTGYPVGQQFRCRCGAVNTVAAPSGQAELLRCPGCGAGVPPTARHCEYCRAELLLKACPRCLSRVFHGHKHCPECGAGLEQAASPIDRADTLCPRCDSALNSRRVSDLVIDECAACHGVFLDQVAVQRVVTDRRQVRAEALLGALLREDIRPHGPGTRLYVKCPTCRNIMNRRQFATGAGVIVDVCKTDGTFFDAGELPRIIEFVMQGGLERAERADIERLRERAKREMSDAQAAKHSAAVMQGSSGFGGLSSSSSSSNALVRFLLELFG